MLGNIGLSWSLIIQIGELKIQDEGENDLLATRL